jgi:hypothetical protein
MSQNATQRPQGWHRLLRPAGTVVLIFLAIAVLDGTGNFLSFKVPEGATGPLRVHWPWWHTFLLSAADWLSLVPLFFITGWIVRRSPLDRGRLRRSLLHHALAILALSWIQQIVSQAFFAATTTLLTSWAQTAEVLRQTPLRDLAAQVFWFPAFYMQMGAVHYALAYRRRERAKDRLALTLERQLAEAQLQMLRMQLNPHFLFNTLNAVTTLMRRDVDQAEEMMLALTEFLRSTLEGTGQVEVSLGQELAVAGRYLDIERIRFGGRVSLDVDLGPGTASVPVPSFLLQPLVENAVRHGLAPRASGGRIQIRAALDTEHLALSVEDDGLGAASPGRRDKGLGLGLANLKERLGQRYGEAASMTAGPLPEGGFCVALRIPRNPVPLPHLAGAGA